MVTTLWFARRRRLRVEALRGRQKKKYEGAAVVVVVVQAEKTSAYAYYEVSSICSMARFSLSL